MSHFDYEASKRVAMLDAPFYALIMAAYRQADTDNAAKLRAAWPDVVAELDARYNAPGGLLPSEAPAFPAGYALQAESEARFEAEVMSGPIVDNASDRLWGANGQDDSPRCVAGDCGTPVEDDGGWCEPCEDAPHAFIPAADPRWPNWCVCGRIRQAGVHDDASAGAA